MMKRACGDCRHFAPHNANLPGNGGACRAAPPVPVIIGQDHLGRPNVGGMWPAVQVDQWCGHFFSYEMIDQRPGGEA